MDSPQPGMVIDGWRLEGILGSGGMGTVFRAWHETKKLKAALKVMTASTASAVSDAQRFRREVQVMGRLSHPSLALILQEALDHEPPYFVMELLEGGDLQKRILDSLEATGRGLPPLTVLKIAGQLAEALAEAHARGVLHRDIKPSNVLFAADGRAKLADFGLAKAQDLTSLTTEQGVKGTLAYMAPEVFRGAKESVRTDLYALGISLHYAVTGKLPFEPSAIGLIVAGNPPPLPSLAKFQLPLRLESAIMALASSEPGERPASAAETVNLLKLAPGPEGRKSSRYRAASGASRPVAAVAPAAKRRQGPAVAAALLLAGALGLSLLWPRARHSNSTGSTAPLNEQSHAPGQAGTGAAGDSLLAAIERQVESETAIELMPEPAFPAERGWRGFAIVCGASTLRSARLEGTTPAPHVLLGRDGPPVQLPVTTGPDGSTWAADIGPSPLLEGLNRFRLDAHPAPGHNPRLVLERAKAKWAQLASKGPKPEPARCPGIDETLSSFAVELRYGDVAKALAVARSLVTSQPDCARARMARLQVLRKVLDLRPGVKKNQVLEAVTILAIPSELDTIPAPQIYAEALAELSALAARTPRWDGYWCEAADWASRLADREGSLRANRWRVLLHPEAPNLWRDLADCECRRASEPQPPDRKSSSSKWVALARLHLDRATALFGKKLPPYVELTAGRVLTLEGRLPQARAAYQRALAATPDMEDAIRELEALRRR